MTSDYTSEAQAVAEAMNAVYENKQTNKKNSISGDFSSDNESYPTVKAVKNEFGTKVTSFNSTPSDTNYPSEKLVKDSLDGKSDSGHTHSGYASSTHNHDSTYVKKAQGSSKASKNVVTDNSGDIAFEDKPAIPTKTSDLTNDGSDGTHPFLTSHQSLTNYVQKSQTAGLLKNDGTVDTNTYLTSHQSLDSKTVTVEKQQTAETGYAATYVVKQNSSQVGVKINIPLDFLVKSGQVKTAAAGDLSTLGSGYSVGDKYIDFIINAKDGSGTDEHMYINVKDLVEDTTYTADGSTLQLSNGQFSIKSAGVNTTQLKNGAVTSDKIATAVKNSWLSSSDVQSEISAFASALAAAINPPST